MGTVRFERERVRDWDGWMNEEGDFRKMGNSKGDTTW